MFELIFTGSVIGTGLIGILLFGDYISSNIPPDTSPLIASILHYCTPFASVMAVMLAAYILTRIISDK